MMRAWSGSHARYAIEAKSLRPSSTVTVGKRWANAHAGGRHSGAHRPAGGLPRGAALRPLPLPPTPDVPPRPPAAPAPPPPADCSQVKGLFTKLGVAAKVVELDELADGNSVQDALRAVTGRGTVPQASGWERGGGKAAFRCKRRLQVAPPRLPVDACPSPPPGVHWRQARGRLRRHHGCLL